MVYLTLSHPSPLASMFSPVWPQELQYAHNSQHQWWAMTSALQLPPGTMVTVRNLVIIVF